MATHHSALTPISDFFLSSEVATMQQTDSAAHKLKPRSFYKSTYLRVYSADFHPSVNCAWQYCQTPKSAVASKQFCLLNPLLQFCLQFNLTNSHFKVQIVKIVDGGLHFLFFSFLFSLFFFYFHFHFLFLEISWVRVCQSHCHISHKTDHKTWENGVEGSGIKWRHTTWTTCIDLMSYTWSFRVGCTAVSMDHE